MYNTETAKQLGYWSNVELVGAMVIAAGIIAWIYKLSLNEFIFLSIYP